MSVAVDPLVQGDALTVRDRVVLALTLAVLVLLPIGRTAELPWLLGAILGIVLACRRGARASIVRVAFVVGATMFAAYALPALVSAIDAVAPDKSWRTALATLRFAPFVLLLLIVAQGRVAWLAPLRAIAAWIVLAWALDAIVQGVSGWSLAGHLDSDRVSGVFGDENLKLGPVLAVLSPFALDHLFARHGRVAFAIGWLVIAAAVLLAGARAGWIMFALVTLAMAWRVAGTPRRFLATLVAAVVAGAAIGAVAYATSERVATRVDRTLLVLSGDAAQVDNALAGRVPIFATATRMAIDHPVNGVGVRGFRYAYIDYAAHDDPWIDPRTGLGAMHPHQVVLEIAAETGAWGIAAWLAAALVAWRAWRRQSPLAHAQGFAPALALVVMTFPVNTHFAFYSSFWSLLLWWLVAVWLAAWRAPEPPR